MRPSRVLAVIVKESREILRDPITLGVAILVPIVMLLIFGYAISLDVENVTMGVADHDHSASSRALVDRFVESGYFELVEPDASESALEDALLRGRIKMALITPPDFQARLARGESPSVQVLVDGTYPATALLIANYARGIAAAFPSPPPAAISLETRVWYNPQLESVNYIVPGLFGVILMAFPPLLTALAITREKESGSITQIYASPLTSAEFVLGKLAPYGAIAFLQIIIVVVFGLIWFGVPFEGNPLLLLGAGLVYVLCTVSLGMLVSTLTNSQVIAMLLALILTLMPSFLFSGFLFPVFTMPYALQLFARIVPAQYYVDFSRAVVLKGSGAAELWPTVALLAAYTLVIFVLAAWRLKKKVA